MVIMLLIYAVPLGTFLHAFLLWGILESTPSFHVFVLSQISESFLSIDLVELRILFWILYISLFDLIIANIPLEVILQSYIYSGF